ncbi:MAG: hypothetical protein DME23_03205 [Verrucomicrobia bacterium]|nr:MAG: hypothetical protein DME23_03205 [Verrucomicrobiota bacterium]
MASHARLQFLRAGLFACVWLVCGAWSGRTADSLSPGATNVSGAEPAPVGAPTFQEQQDVIQQAIEQTRREVEAAAMRNAEALTQRLTLIQQSLETQHQREVEAVQRSNRTALMVAGALAATGLLGMFCLAFFLMRATNRLTEVAMAVPLSHALGTGYSPNVLTAGDSPLAVGNPTELASARFLGAIEQLEKRLRELEQTAQEAASGGTSGHANEQPNRETAKAEANSDTKAAVSTTPHDPEKNRSAWQEPASDSSHPPHVALLLAKGQTLLSLDKPAEALACLEEVISLDPRNAEALIKRGNALERLRRTEEALECYDRAIAVDSSLTTAYLYKGGVFNRLQRFEEALKCYEQALQTEQKTLAS